jgi:hypothetical protein
MNGLPPPGAQPERTRLAWRRTTLAFAVAAALAVRGALYHPSPAAYGAAALGALTWLGFLVVAHRRIRALSRPGVSGTEGGAVRATVLCALVLAALGVVLLW